MSNGTDNRGTTYSAQAAGDAGSVHCRVIRRRPGQDGRAQYSIVIDNATDDEVQAIAFVPESPDQRYRSIVQTTIAPTSEVATTVIVQIEPSGLLPEVHVALAGGNIQFTLAVPSLASEVALPAVRSTTTALAVPNVTPLALLRPNLPAVQIAATSPQRQLAVVAPMPMAWQSRERTTLRTAPALTPILLLFLALIGIVALVVLRPRIDRFSVPRQASAKTLVAVSYDVSGLGQARYTVLDSDGNTISGRPVKSGAGSFAIALPKTGASQAYLVRLSIATLLGSAQAEDYVRVAGSATPPPRAPERRIVAVLAPPIIRSLALDRATMESGDLLNVYYDVGATSGTIALLDPATQITYSKSQLSPAGHSTFVAPRLDAEHYLTVALDAQRGNATTQSRIGVTVSPRASPSPTVAPEPTAPEAILNAPDDIVGGDSRSNRGGSATAALSAPDSVHSGQPIRLTIAHAGVGLQVVFLDGTGSELARRDVARGQSSEVFTAPVVRIATRYIFEATYPRGTGTETVVRTIAVLP